MGEVRKNPVNGKVVLVGAAAAGIVTAVLFAMAGEDGGVESQIDEGTPIEGVSPTGTYHDNYVMYPGTEEIEPDEMRIIACGTGMPVARPSQSGACFLVELGNGEKFIFDIGNGSTERIAGLRIPYQYMNKVFVSHLHADHVGDLDTFFIARMVGGATNPLHVYGPTGSTPELGTAAAVEHLNGFLRWDLTTRVGAFAPGAGELVAHEFDWSVENEVVYEENGVTVRSWPAIHAIEGAVSYSLEWNGLKFVFGGDNFPNTYFTEFASDADVVVHECFLTVEDLVEKLHFPLERALIVGAQVHTPPEMFGDLMRRIEPRMAIAYHFWNEFDTAPSVIESIRQTYDGPLSLANDWLVWNVTEEAIRVREVAVHEAANPPPIAATAPPVAARFEAPDYHDRTAIREPSVLGGLYDRINMRYGTMHESPYAETRSDEGAESDD